MAETVTIVDTSIAVTAARERTRHREHDSQPLTRRAVAPGAPRENRQVPERATIVDTSIAVAAARERMRHREHVSQPVTGRDAAHDAPRENLEVSKRMTSIDELGAWPRHESGAPRPCVPPTAWLEVEPLPKEAEAWMPPPLGRSTGLKPRVARTRAVPINDLVQAQSACTGTGACTGTTSHGLRSNGPRSCGDAAREPIH
jgi:hypothetical protein